MEIGKYKTQINQLAPMAAGFVYKTQTWGNLSPSHKLAIEDFEDKMIVRADVIEAFRRYFENGDGFMRAFLLTMVWGFADTGYGTYRTNNYIGSPENLQLIKQGIDAVKNNDLQTAFKTLKRIKGLGVSYLTKVLYFASKGAGMKDYALIFDIRVASALIQLTSPKAIFDLVSVHPSSKYEDYAKYNKLIHELAVTNNLEADAIELFLFEQKF